jgi:hypothetical protein
MGHRRWTAITVALTGALLTAVPAAAQQTSLNVGPSGAITFTPGLRVQPRYTYDNADGNNDFFIARVRFKGAGNAFGIATYFTELKLDNVGRFARTVSAQIENAWMNFALQPALALRVGLYDAVFSRDALTSDSKLLFMDRSLVKDALTAVGLADNTVGLLAHSRPAKGRFEISGGVFDNLAFETGGTGANARQADGAMVGRSVPRARSAPWAVSATTGVRISAPAAGCPSPSAAHPIKANTTRPRSTSSGWASTCSSTRDASPHRPNTASTIRTPAPATCSARGGTHKPVTW